MIKTKKGHSRVVSSPSKQTTNEHCDPKHSSGNPKITETQLREEALAEGWRAVKGGESTYKIAQDDCLERAYFSLCCTNLNISLPTL